ncbi:mRNA interferase EndoA [Gemmata obscuriglobus]|uniref:Type II toxin-antitoxin system PemK/MazF family toxin n=1 Tax=Gemmata obscuriglobus TaxID=114 RepID=A0A2Z3H6H2_9BACT|nr:type II toxin-antitoxin system PemK/MazF family toxin [Gemmata obscuriglobus]AWM41613.1 type II toxin-antitoxin system PemK/MazF family toxin [Gemmata obscuriglobus]QEG32463.1 mRNA interferase EndoA [Gemmata obscuriglobus]VTS11819.1 growth inhibitor : mRNA interferase OS=Desulfotomaculum kuznetsovii (strain DSM 6115 / VKM B-1805 / 17) GN=Desku_1596 PE=3 SV=1: PemK [Gemmata obscuriglobus UQM 2246]
MTAPVRGEVWMLDLSPVRGHEQQGTRPALILSVDAFNSSKAELVVVLPVTSKKKYALPTHIPLDPPEGGLTMPSVVLCDQVRAVSKDRLIRRLGAV